MNKAAIEHIAGFQFAYPVSLKELNIRLKTAKNDIKTVTIEYQPRYYDPNNHVIKIQKLEKVSSDELFDYYETIIKLDDSRVKYHFLIDDGTEQLWFNENGFYTEKPIGFTCGHFNYPEIPTDSVFKVPDWLHGATVYQIFMERFRNGNPAINPPNTQTWGGKPENEVYYGGDIEGIIQSLDYLKDLGVKIIYLTPIFKASNYHKYNSDDFYCIDPHFGDLLTAKRLVNEAHKRNMKVVLDVVFNHVGSHFFAFEDVRKNGEKSKYKDWFFIKDFPLKETYPINYKTFAIGVTDSPAINTANPEVQKYLLEVVKYWHIEINLDGWRLDVANELSQDFLRQFRILVKSLNPNAYILGEIWTDASLWLQGDQLDGVMNYKFQEIVLRCFAENKISVETMLLQLNRQRMLYKNQAVSAAVNMLDSHDTPRIVDLCNGNWALAKLAVVFQMIYPGMPLVFYGNEIGLNIGIKDLTVKQMWLDETRICMEWNTAKQDLQLLDFYKKLIRLRNENDAIKYGDFQIVEIQDEAFCISRNYNGKSVYVIINKSNEAKNFKLNNKLHDYFSNEEFEEKAIQVNSLNFRILL